MQMHDMAALLLAGLAGGALGGFFFGGLWWTVRQAMSPGLAPGRAALWQLGSLLLRMGVTLLGFHAIGAGHWERLAACLAGFTVARCVATRMTRTTSRQAGRRAPAPGESSHAPQP
ncbi:ATP synthase subunit I [Cupriavidus sp. 30B13]|uniref:N-ATPase subunit AtpR n=1 Tax=Cupriavidus sp. 30B13 TaxID=3384241 RepID=UPI003B8FEFA3